MSCTRAAWSALKTAAGWSDRVVSALRDHVHYILNYVLEGGAGPQDPRVEVVLRCLWADHEVLTPNIHKELPLTSCH